MRAARSGRHGRDPGRARRVPGLGTGASQDYKRRAKCPGYARRVVGGWRSTRSASSKTCVTREGGTGEVLGRPPARKTMARKVGQRVKARRRISSLSEKPRPQRPRRLSHWINVEQSRKVHSLVDKVYSRKNLALAWKAVRRKSWGGWSRPAESGRLCVESGGEPRVLARGVADEDVQAVRAATGPHSEGGQEGRVATSWDSRRFVTASANRHWLNGWRRSSSRILTTAATGTALGGRHMVRCARSGAKSRPDGCG